SWDPKDTKGYDWPARPSGIAVDDKGNVWIGSGAVVGTPPAAGRGGAGRGAAAGAAGAAAAGRGDAAAGAGRGAGRGGAGRGGDGFGNHRVAVFDATSGAFKRSWGAYGEKPTDADAGAYDPNGTPSKQFHTVSCVKIAKDGMVYVCDRQNDRIQVFQKDGKFVKEGFVSKTTTGDGSVWDLAFSRDPQQSTLYVADGHDKKVWIVNRSSLATSGSFGDGGRL